MTLPGLCAYHQVVYALKARRLRRRGRIHHPGARAQLVEEATLIAGQCPGCPDP